MTLRENIFAALTSGSPTPIRAYTDTLPQKVVLPALTFYILHGDDDFHLLGRSGLFTRWVQMDAWAGTRLGADALIQTALTLMLASGAFDVTAITETAAAPFEPETGRYRASFEVKVWSEIP